MAEEIVYSIVVQKCPDNHPNSQLHGKWLALAFTGEDEFVKGWWFDTEQEAYDCGNWMKDQLVAAGGVDARTLQ